MKDCNECRFKKDDSKPVEPVPYIVHEATMARMERHNKRLWIACIVLAVIVFASNALWLWAWMQYDYAVDEEVYTYEQDGKGVNIVGDNNSDQRVINGEESDGAENNLP